MLHLDRCTHVAVNTSEPLGREEDLSEYAVLNREYSETWGLDPINSFNLSRDARA
jgi:hypothetical protein